MKASPLLFPPSPKKSKDGRCIAYARLRKLCIVNCMYILIHYRSYAGKSSIDASLMRVQNTLPGKASFLTLAGWEGHPDSHQSIESRSYRLTYQTGRILLDNATICDTNLHNAHNKRTEVPGSKGSKGTKGDNSENGYHLICLGKKAWENI